MVEHLRSRTMAGLPHIGVLGPKWGGETDQPSDIEEDESTQPTESEDNEALYPDWKFVPNKMSYQITVKPQNGSALVTRISFSIRTREGCDGDASSEPDDRPKQYRLTPEELLKAFRTYELVITTASLLDKPTIRLDADKETVTLKDKQVDIETDTERQKISILIEDSSDVFLTYKEGSPRLTRQNYRIRYTRSVTKHDDDLIVYSDLRNESSKTARSVIPERRLDKASDVPENEESAMQRLEEKLPGDPLFGSYSPRFLQVEGLRNNPSGNRYGYLMEAQMEEEVHSSRYPYDERDAAKTANCIMDDHGLEQVGEVYQGKVVFKDHAMFEEDVPQMTLGSTPTELCSELGLDPNIQAVFNDDLGFRNFYLFQTIAIRTIVGKMRASGGAETILISARTAGGKTEAFLVPITQFCLETRGQMGVKALVFYPTKALANDQTNRYIEMLYYLNRRLIGQKITLGLLHGDISKMEPEPGSEEEWDLPLSCPKHDNGVLRSEGSVLKCSVCGETIDFVRVRNRQMVYSNPPDILITNPDTLIWDLMMRPQNHSIFGRPVFVCKDCGRTYVSKAKKKKCENPDCKSSNISLIEPVVPRFIVFDEVHMFKGTFGINCSYFISRLEAILRKYGKEFHHEPSPKLVRIGSTATISNPREFGEDFFDTPANDVVLVPRDEDERRSFYVVGNRDKTIRRHHVYIMPYAYNTDSTIGRSIHYIQMRSKKGTPPTQLQGSRQAWDQFLQTITFVNSIRASNNLIALTRRTVANDLPDISINGHTTDFDKKSRAKVERAFNRAELHCIFATQTLEVGVDFRRVDVVVINGFPFSFNDYLQRIGRGGRNRDSLVVTVCQNWKPIDHYYFSNARRALRDPMANIEPVPITRNNIEAMRKHVRGAVFDYIASEIDLNDHLADFRKFDDISGVVDQIQNHCVKALGSKGVDAKEVAKCLGEFSAYLENAARNEIAPNTLFNKFRVTINDKYQLTSLRSTDREVTVEVLWNK